MKEILIPLNFTTTPTVYDTKQSFSTSDEASGVLTFTTTADVAGTVASLTIRNANENANRQTVLIKRLDVNSSPFSYTLKKPLPFGQYEGTILLKKNLTVIASATFLFGVNSSLAAEVLPDLVKAYALDELVENVETEVSNLKDAFTLTVSETVKGVNKTESTMQLSENVRYLAEESRKVNNLLWKTQAEAHALAEEGRVTEFRNLVDSAVIEQTVAQEVANEFQEIEATYANRLLSTEQQLADNTNVLQGIDRTFGYTTYATLVDLQTAYPTGDAKRYIVAADGKWYWWNGTSWTAGQVADKSITSAKIAKSVMKNPLSNLFGSVHHTATTYSGATGVESGGVFTVTSSTTFGSIYGKLQNLDGMTDFILFAKVAAPSGSSAIGALCNMKAYAYDAVNTSLGAATQLVLGQGSVTLQENVYQNLFSKYTIANKPTATRIDFGFGVTGVGQVFNVKDFYIIDVTGLTDAEILKLDVVALYGKSSRNTEPLKATLSDKSTSATTAEVASWANDGNFAKYILEYENLSGNPNTIPTDRIWGNGTDTPSNVAGVISATPLESWGQILIKVTNKVAQNKKVTVTFNAKRDVAGVITIASFQFKDGTNLGQTLSTGFSLTTEWQRVTYTVILDKLDVNTFWAGPTNSGGTAPYSKIYMKDFMVLDVTDVEISNDTIDQLGGVWNVNPTIVYNSKYAIVAEQALNIPKSIWYGKKVLVMGDSLTAANQWQNKVASIHGCTITTHAKGGIGIPAVVGGSLPELPALDTAKVADKDLIILFIGMNERATPYGVKGDLYPTQNTVWGKMQYAINRIFELLTTSGNLDCKVMVVTPHCAGKYAYIDYDGYQEYPVGTGQTLEKLSDTLKTIGQYNNCRVVDLWHNSGIGKFTWNLYTASPTPIADPPLTGTPYPNNADQLHLNNTMGYPRIGEVIAEEMNLL